MFSPYKVKMQLLIVVFIN